MSELKGKLALVTGAAGGLGVAISTTMAAAGARVLMHDLPGSTGAAACEAINRKHGRDAAIFVGGDLADLPGLKAQAGTLVAEHGPIDILVNNAAVNPLAPIEAYSLEEFARVQAVNAHSAFVLCQAVVPGMKAKTGGAIVNICSLTLSGGVADMVPYVLSKGSLLGLTRSLAREVGPANIRVNAISPGAIPTELERRVWAHKLAEVEASVLERQSLKFRGSAEDIAEAVLFLASPRSRFITGHELHVNGGWYMG
jgi:NAD(P)-dependent dehydrogenase (short-subunit alcohol dehydrogenase family)